MFLLGRNLPWHQEFICNKEMVENDFNASLTALGMDKCTVSSTTSTHDQGQHEAKRASVDSQ
jgi:hypothetical protein